MGEQHTTNLDKKKSIDLISDSPPKSPYLRTINLDRQTSSANKRSLPQILENIKNNGREERASFYEFEIVERESDETFDTTRFRQHSSFMEPIDYFMGDFINEDEDEYITQKSKKNT